MGMNINVTKLSDINGQWGIDVEPSDLILAIKSKLIVAETPSLFLNTSKIRLFSPAGDELVESSTLTDYNIIKDTYVPAIYSADVTVCGASPFNGKEVNGLYSPRGWDPGGFYYYTRVVGNETFYITFDSVTSDRWILSPESDFTNILAYTGHTVRAAHAFTPYPESAFDNDNGVWQGGVTVSEGNVPCSSDCNPIFDKFAYLSEDGCTRFKRLRNLGYL